MRTLFLWFSSFAPVFLQAQTFYLRPYGGISVAYSHWHKPPEILHKIERKGNWFPNVGLSLVFQKKQLSLSTGIGIGVAAHAVQKYDRLDSVSQRFESYSEQNAGKGTISFPVETSFRLLKVSQGKFYLDLLGGVSVIHLLGTRSKTQIGFGSLRTFVVPVRRWSGAAFLGLRITTLQSGSDSWALSLLYNRGWLDLIQADVRYEYGKKSFAARAASRGSYFAVQVSKPIRLYESAAVKQQRLQTLFSDSTQHPPMQRLADWQSGQFRAYAKGMYFPGTVENMGNVEVGLQYVFARRLAINVGLYHYVFTYKLSEKRFSQYYAAASLTKYFRGRYANPYLSVGLGYDLKMNNGWYPLVDGGVNLKLTERSRLDISTRIAFIRSRSNWQWIPVNFGYSRRLSK